MSTHSTPGIQSVRPLACLPMSFEAIEALRAAPRETVAASYREGRGRLGHGRAAVVELVGYLDGEYLRSVRRQVDRLAADDGVASIVLWVNSGGGSIEGVPELAAAIRKARDRKPVVACAEGLCASAAFWIAAAASPLVVAPSCLTGGIGVFLLAVDDHELHQRLGVRVVRARTGSLKAVGVAGQAISDEEAAWMQSHVDSLLRLFHLDVLKTERMSPSELLRLSTGEVWVGASAVSLKLADRVGLLEDVLAEADAAAEKRHDQQLASGKRALAEYNALVCQLAGVNDVEEAFQCDHEEVRESHPELAAEVDEYRAQAGLKKYEPPKRYERPRQA
ncbi:putative signal peptide peptidase SppA [Posidoniimonas polymericola]|uniref:Putative signal peptide peptidase SppA n=1 Tax=Posidoniimonas polymericola TaxID=2528002 RepID=A0A5C5YMK2_9BACT|nr:S49 family peptidase [Posidoniimonas polymericola]TWT76096.1 putative signal peptide peptidase SppA [Posidoniimonas polymericola]